MVRLRHLPVPGVGSFILGSSGLLCRKCVGPATVVPGASAAAVCRRALRLACCRRPALAGREVIPRGPLASGALRRAGDGGVMAAVLAG
jgi:hypothetical protein